MKGLVIWAQSACRSQMALYRALEKVLGVPVEVAVWYYRKDPRCEDNRTVLGFRDDEFSDMIIYPVGDDLDKGRQVLFAHKGWHHLFCCYQWSATFRQLQLEAANRGDRTAVGSESPCNMFAGWRRLAKEIYFRTRLPRMLRDVIAVSDFFINYSGDSDAMARLIGWPKEKIIPFGYYPPALPGTKRVRREGGRPFTILTTGEMTRHRGSDVFLQALRLLRDRGVNFHATITQNGPLYEQLKKIAECEQLPVDFVGLLPLDALHKVYEDCSVFVGAGRCEPWGMRLNDALNCGAPLVVSRGMGGVKLVDEYGCGLAFENADADDLARQLERLATDEVFYRACAEKAMEASVKCLPQEKAGQLAVEISRFWPDVHPHQMDGRGI